MRSQMELITTASPSGVIAITCSRCSSAKPIAQTANGCASQSTKSSKRASSTGTAAAASAK
jgi:hypothetical protein